MLAATGLEAGLDAFNIDHIREDIFFLASDEMGGRDSPSPEQRIAARYIRTRLIDFGWQPGWKDSYLHPYQLPANKINLEESGLTIKFGGKSEDYTLGEDYYFDIRYVGNRNVSGKAVWVGDLVNIEVEDFDLEGRWAVGEASRGISGKRRTKLLESGCVGVMVLPQEGAENTVKQAQDRRFRFIMGSGGVSTATSEFAYLYLTEPVAERVKKSIGKVKPGDSLSISAEAVSYTHLTLPTIYSV